MTEQRKQAIVIGGGLAGCEAAWQLAQNGVAVTLYEQKPVHYSRHIIGMVWRNWSAPTR